MEYENAAGCSLALNPRSSRRSAASRSRRRSSGGVAPTPATPARRYRGILATGERLKSVEIRVASAVLEHAQYLFDRYGAAADPYMTVVDYFTSTRELAGCAVLSTTTSRTDPRANRCAPGVASPPSAS